MKVAIGVDIGGTKIACAIITEQGKVTFRHEVASEISCSDCMFEAVLRAIDITLESAGITIDYVEGIGVGIPGKVDIETGVAIFQNNIPWKNFPIRDKLRSKYQITNVKIDNDVKVAAYAEYRMQLLLTNDIFGYLTVSTGIASCNIVNNQILRGAGFSGEIGYVPIPTSTGLIPLELVASGPAIEKVAQSLTGDYTLTTKEVFDLWNNYNENATQAIEQSIIGVAMLIYNMICFLDPKVIVLGGSVPVKNPKYVERVIDILSKFVQKEQQHILKSIKISTLGSDSGIVGAGLLIFDVNLKY